MDQNAERLLSREVKKRETKTEVTTFLKITIEMTERSGIKKKKFQFSTEKGVSGIQ